MTDLTASDGHTFQCYMTPAEGKAHGGLVIIQEIFGVTEQLIGVARRYAREGYDVAIPALFDRQERGAVIPFDEASRGRDLMMATLPDEAMLDVQAAVEKLAETGQPVGVMGFCWGGGLAVRAAQKLEIAGAVSFYGTRLKEYLDLPLRAPVQCHCGTEDDHTPKALMEEVQDHLPEIEICWYEAGHAFANDARDSYVPEAAETAHSRALEFLRAHVG
ncbi:dienelactone hydrolase family protein [Psychromarinibacter sp. C21-152]|uniref:Dienelactone hydrolase family protein n=1 Tax=Psychromarinibacter sediminicola TaxID=3033385 RepID=A0AAE3NQM7_9RHOB|nr:dienelactone hydrolase family protein [Psychromarinibacter sediminicola]MDF0600296.1 dienelactone hydrolase family protein [Psychromarinibacter sediminicola]